MKITCDRVVLSSGNPHGEYLQFGKSPWGIPVKKLVMVCFALLDLPTGTKNL